MILLHSVTFFPRDSSSKRGVKAEIVTLVLGEDEEMRITYNYEGPVYTSHNRRIQFKDLLVNSTIARCINRIAHFRVELSLSIKARPGAQPFI